jgi:hypothetical protein
MTTATGTYEMPVRTRIDYCQEIFIKSCLLSEPTKVDHPAVSDEYVIENGLTLGFRSYVAVISLVHSADIFTIAFKSFPLNDTHFCISTELPGRDPQCRRSLQLPESSIHIPVLMSPDQ